LEIVPYSAAEHEQAVERLNAKLVAGRSEFQFPTQEPAPPAGGVWFEHFVAAEDGEAYGGCLLKHQKFFVHGEPVELDNLQLPLSLGLIDNRYAHVSAALLFDALGRNELLYCLGMGSQQSRLVKLLTAAGWQHQVVPFFFSIKSANRFARNIRLPPERRWLQRALRALGHARLAAAGLWTLAKLRGGRPLPSAPDVTVTEAPRFGRFADELFEQQRTSYALLGDRRADALNALYPPSNPTFRRLLVEKGGRLIGWAVVLDTAMHGHKYFGDMRVGTLADCLADRADAAAIVAAADRYLTDRGVDLVVSNQLHPAWAGALRQAGYREGPSNFFFYFSPALRERLSARPDWQRGLHINRGDGDGPIHL
jgi:hypothetical protein